MYVTILDSAAVKLVTVVYVLGPGWANCCTGGSQLLRKCCLSGFLRYFVDIFETFVESLSSIYLSCTFNLLDLSWVLPQWWLEVHMGIHKGLCFIVEAFLCKLVT